MIEAWGDESCSIPFGFGEKFKGALILCLICSDGGESMESLPVAFGVRNNAM